MNKELIQTRKYNGEEYKFYLISPSYDGELGCLGVELRPYIQVLTPQNDFGYEDIIQLNTVRSYDNSGVFIGYRPIVTTTYRYLPNWILKGIQKQIITLYNKLGIEIY